MVAITSSPAIHNVPMTSNERSEGVGEIPRPSSGVLGGKPVTVGDGAQGERANETSNDHKKGFLSSLLAAGWSAVSVPATLLFNIGSSLLAMAGDALELLVELAEISESDFMDDFGGLANALVDGLNGVAGSD